MTAAAERVRRTLMMHARGKYPDRPPVAYTRKLGDVSDGNPHPIIAIEVVSFVPGLDRIVNDGKKPAAKPE